MTSNATHIAIEIRPAGPQELEAAGRVFSTAFQAEGITRRLVDLSTPRRRARHARLMTLDMTLRRAQGQHILVAAAGEEIVGVALVRWAGEAGGLSLGQRARLVLPMLPGLVGLLGQVRWRNLRRTLAAMQPPQSHDADPYMLDGLAVSTDCQGQGIGRRLLEAVYALAARDARAAAIHLCTADERNRAIYERAGYELVAVKGDASDVMVYHMRRPLSAVPEARRQPHEEPTAHETHRARNPIAAADLNEMLWSR